MPPFFCVVFGFSVWLRMFLVLLCGLGCFGVGFRGCVFCKYVFVVVIWSLIVSSWFCGCLNCHYLDV